MDSLIKMCEGPWELEVTVEIQEQLPQYATLPATHAAFALLEI
jgi:hypothetical protein